MPIQHVKTLNIADGTNTDIVLPSDWNSVHAYTLVDCVSVLGNNTAGTLEAITNGSFCIAGGNNITLSQDGNTVSFVGQGVDGIGVSNLGNTSGNTGIITNNSFVLAGGNNIVLSQDTNSNGATVSISHRDTYLSAYEPYPFQNTGTGLLSAPTSSTAPMSLFRFSVLNPCVAEYAKMVFSMSYSSSSNYYQNGTVQWGIYSRLTGSNSTLMHLMGSNSFGYTCNQAGTQAALIHPTTTNVGGGYSDGTVGFGSHVTAISGRYTGLKALCLGLNSTFTPGEYWMGMHNRCEFATSGGGIRMSLYGVSHTLTGLAPMGSFSSAYSTGTNVPTGMGGNWLPGHGSYSIFNMVSLPSSISMSQITANVGLMPYMKFESRV